MAVNKYFRSHQEVCEQDLVQDLLDEAIQIRGIDVWYVPRTKVNEDYLFGEDPLSSFDETFEIEMYLETFDQYGGEGDLLGRFGLHVKDQAQLNVSTRRFTEVTSMDHPLEGDLIYIPMSNALLEIRFVEDEEQFYALGKNYNFKLQCQLFEYSREDFSTGLEDLDEITDALDDSDGEIGTDPYGTGDELEVEGDDALDPDSHHLFGDN